MKASIDYRNALLDEVKDMPQEILPNLLKIIRLFKQCILAQRTRELDELQHEVKQWDQLSDKALVDFEKEL